MRANITKVIKAALLGRDAAGDSKRTCSSAARCERDPAHHVATIFSYNMAIASVIRSCGHSDCVAHGITCGEERLVLLVVPDGPSRTTRSQIAAVRKVARVEGLPIFTSRWLDIGDIALEERRAS